ncbi:MAG: efflux RND transporter periplasmic adaptor subunit [Cryomorphaceae bacterium]|nr:efflux RND transporter periplasmic adaptor subunit [Flavobacteriales bacterium]
MAKTKSRKRLYWILALVIVALVITAVVVNRGSDLVKVTTAEAERRNITESVIANGKIQPETEVVISSEVSGKILELPFKEGAKVAKGDLIVKINPDLAQSALDRAEASLNSAKANKANAKARVLQAEAQLKNAEVVYQRNQNLLNQGAISQAEFDNFTANYESAQAEVMAAEESEHAAQYSVASARATVKEARDSYSRTTIYAPMDGTISSLKAEVGEQVVGAMQMTGTEIMRVANLEVMEVLAEVNESDIVRIAFGDTASIEVDAYRDRKFTGEVTEIANSATSSGMSADQVTNFEVKIRILKSSYKDLIDADHPELSPFRPGMNATVEIYTDRAEDAIAVPIEAVTSRTDTSASQSRSTVDKLMGDKAGEEKEPITCVFTLNGDKVGIAAVKTGVQDDKYIAILEGLSEGDKIVSGPYDAVSLKLSPGDEVESVSKDDLYKK